MKRVFLLGAYGQNNLGDEALLEVFLQQFPDAEITVNSAQPELTAERFGVKSVGTYWNWPPRFSRLRAMLQADVFIFGGGSLLKEIEGGPVQRLAYFARIFFILILARLFGKQTAMLGVGMGPLEHRLYKTLTRLAAALPDLICVRDQESVCVTRTRRICSRASVLNERCTLPPMQYSHCKTVLNLAKLSALILGNPMLWLSHVIP